MTASRRVVVFTGNLSYSVRKGIVDIDEAIPSLEWLILLHSPPKTAKRLLRNQWLNLKRNGWRWIPYQFLDLLHRWGNAAPPKSADAPGAAYTSGSLSQRPNVRLIESPDIHSAESLATLINFQPDLGISLAAPILRRSIFAVPSLGTINLHKGRLPDFRGMPPAFWELWHDEREVGCSVHVVDDKLDTGAVLASGTVQRSLHSTLRGLQLQLDEMGASLTCLAAKAVLAGTALAQPQPVAQGRTFRKPTLRQQAALRAKLATVVPFAERLRQGLKNGAAVSGIAVHNIALRRVLAPRVTVLLYHRVSDDVRDNLTVGIEQFDRQMAIVAQRCQVLSIGEVLALDAVPRSTRPLVAITFDDGYLDNYEHAFPTLVRHCLPAAFFVSTGLIGTNGRFPHDVRRGNLAIPLMGWDQLRAMAAAGYTIGSHTVNHIDCAAEPESVVRGELVQSSEDIHRELGIDRPILGYPYGGRQHMTPSRLEWVKQAGYVGCLSAYGGANIGRVDRYNVLRKGINHAFSDRAFEWDCLGLR